MTRHRFLFHCTPECENGTTPDFVLSSEKCCSTPFFDSGPGRHINRRRLKKKAATSRRTPKTSARLELGWSSLANCDESLQLPFLCFRGFPAHSAKCRYLPLRKGLRGGLERADLRSFPQLAAMFRGRLRGRAAAYGFIFGTDAREVLRRMTTQHLRD